MEGSDGGSPPSSMYLVRAPELYPKPALEKEDEDLKIPFTCVAGESVKYLGRTDDGVLALSNYRLFLLKKLISETSVPLGLIESAQTRDLFHLIINCKDASTVKCSFATSEQCSEWQRRITLSVGVPETLEDLFAFPFHSWASDSQPINSSASDSDWGGSSASAAATSRLQRVSNYDDDFRKEVERLQFDLQGAWRISHANSEFKLCPSYPRMLLVPACISDDTLQTVASFRSSRRIPAVVWRHKGSGAIIARCSQPEVGWLGWRNSKDEQLLKAFSDACAFDKGQPSVRTRNDSTTSNESSPPSPEGSHEEVTMDEPKKILIVDARSYTSAVTNRARGGGCECAEYYPCAEIQFMSLGNIHVIRKSFHALRQLCASPPDIPNWLSILERTTWLQHMSGLLAASVVVAHAIEHNGRPVLVHCSDGWDRTPQIVATAQLCLDPYYRTVEGFRVLVEREWLSFGHKFADRCGHGPGSDETNERCPVFIQWLDCVHQIHRQYTCSFEFSMGYLIKLAQHSHSCLFGTFLCNTVKERLENSIPDRTFSVWPFLSGPIYKNPLYVPNKERVLWPAHNVRDLALWSEVYLGSLGNNQNTTLDCPTNGTDGNVTQNGESTSPMIKTRSYGDLITGVNQGGLTRRSSDPNMSVESSMLTPLNISHENSIDSNLSSDNCIETLCNNSNGLINSDYLATSILQDTTQKLQNLTNELKKSDDDGDLEINKVQNHTSLLRCAQDDVVYNPSLYNNHLDEGKNGNALSYDHNYDVDDDDCIDGPINNFYSRRDEMENLNMNTDDSKKLSQNLWHGNVETSTDTLVPVDMDQQQQLKELNKNTQSKLNISVTVNEEQNLRGVSGGGDDISHDGTNGLGDDADHSSDILKDLVNCDDNNECDFNSIKDKIFTINKLENDFENLNERYQQKQHPLQQNGNMNHSRFKNLAEVHEYSNSSNNNLNNTNVGNYNGKMKTLSNHFGNSVDDTLTSSNIQLLQQQQQLSNQNQSMNNNVEVQPNTIRRRNSSNSKPDLSPKFHINGNISPSATHSKYSTPGIRSLPLTPPGLQLLDVGRPSVALSCPDGLAHALSEQNLRLQQIVYEHKLREEALQRELYATRLALLKKTCNQCSTQQQLMSDEPTSLVDSIIENASVCSWEAVDEKGSQLSGINSSAQQNGNVNNNSVLWVPDYAVSRCTNCHTEFWLGRRRHHCRSCGNIFCADCSEYWAALPDERLYQPVRLCSTCYHNVTGKIQQSSTVIHNKVVNRQLNNIQTSMVGNQSTMNLVSSTQQQQSSHHNLPQQQMQQQQQSQQQHKQSALSTVTATSPPLEPCKHAVSVANNNSEREHLTFKTTTATN